MKIKWNMAAFRAIRFDPVAVRVINNAAVKIAAAAGDGYEVGAYSGTNRPRASVITATYKAQRDNAKNNTLARSIDAAR